MRLTSVTPLLFVLRWISHFCAPVFTFLMGVSAGLSGADSRRLIARGLVLIVLEFTLIDWAWTFYPPWPRKFWQVIAALGVASIALGGAAVAGRRAALIVGGLIVGLHNLADGLAFTPGTWLHYAWSFLHQKNVLPLFAGFEVRTTYPVLPIVGVALLGYGMASWFQRPDWRKRLSLAGWIAVGLFLLLRASNLHGDPYRFVAEGGLLRTLQSFGNVTKYPLSLQFVLMTLGPALLLLPLLPDRDMPVWAAWLKTLGQVPLFFYVGHLYLLHAMALAAASVQGMKWADFSKRFGGIPEGFGFPLWMTVPIALVATLALLPACGWYARLRASKRYPVLSYL